MMIKRRSRGARRKGRVVEVLSRSPEETHRLGISLAGTISVPGVILLRGALGTGKTTLTRGLAEGMGLMNGSLFNSPSFTLVNIYHGQCPIYHVDLYRLSGERDIRSIGLDDFLGRDGITVVEWSERLGYPLPAALEVELEDAGGETRRIRIHRPSTALDDRSVLRGNSTRWHEGAVKKQPGLKRKK
jgi:tRNA threonylcarbamoyladenosine biosynthesis protein TsaE